MSQVNSFKTQSSLAVSGKEYQICSFQKLDQKKLERLPYSLKVLLENMLRLEDGVDVTKDDIEALLDWDSKAAPSQEISFTPARVLMQDFTGVPAVVDLAAMRDAMKNLGGDVEKINPLSPADLVIDHSVMVDFFGSDNALDLNAELEFRRNKERYEFLRWGSTAFDDFQVVPPATGICHQVNLEFLAKAVFTKENNGQLWAYPDTLVGTDSHTTMINGLGVLGWGVGGIEAEAAMLGQPITMLIPHVIGFKLEGKLKEGATATDLVLRVVEMLREKGVVGKFVEFYGDGLDSMSLADKATIANMAPEYGATCGIFPIDKEALNYMRLSGRSDEQIELVEAYAKHQGMFREKGAAEAEYTDSLYLNLEEVVPSLAGPKRPQDRIDLSSMASKVKSLIKEQRQDGDFKSGKVAGEDFAINDGDVVIAAITSCTNTSNPDVMVAAGLVAKKAVELGLKVKPWVKTSLAPGSQVVSQYLENAGLDKPLDELGFDVVGFGCTTCIGNSGPLPEGISPAINDNDLYACSVLSGNRNFEGRVHGDVRMNFLASPPLVVAYALAGNTMIDLYKDVIGQDKKGNDVYLKDIWPSHKEIRDIVNSNVTRKLFQEKYGDVFKGDTRWQAIKSDSSEAYQWDADSTYIQNPPYFENMSMDVNDDLSPIEDARVLAFLGDSITTDHISPAGAFKEDTPAGEYLKSKGIQKADFNSYGSRRGNHEVMMRGTFANVRLRNELAPGTEGGWTRFQPTDEEMSIYDAAMKYKEQNTPLMVIAGKEYGTGSSRDWAAKGSILLGVKAVLTESFERIHRSNLVGMGVLPLQFKQGESKQSHDLTGKEIYSIEGLGIGVKDVTVVVKDNDGKEVKRFDVLVRIDTPKEWDYYKNGGILHYVLRQLAKAS